MMDEAYYQGYCTGIKDKPIDLRPASSLILTAPKLLAEFHYMVRQGHADGREQALLIRKKAQEKSQERDLDLER